MISPRFRRMLTRGLCATVMALAAAPAGVRASAPVEAIRRDDENSRLGHLDLLAKARAGGISLYFLGDSITRRWGATDYPAFLEHWQSTFHGWNAGNFGWGGDTTRNALWRIQNGELDGVNPRVIVLLIGTNDIGRTAGDAATVDRVVQGIEAILATCRAKAPDAKIVLMGIFPRNDGPVMPVITAVNARLAGLADGGTIRFLNINDRLADADGQLRPGVSGDQLHLTLEGYRIWGEALVPVLNELLGPRAATDTAPPPTGDPAARR